MKKIIILILGIFVLLSCNENTELDDVDCELPGVRIRLLNASSYKFSNIIVNSQSGNKDFGDLNAGQKSKYQTFELAYRYGFVELEIFGDTYTIQPIDYFGETPLTDGAYTYVIDANNSQEQYGKLSLNLVENCSSFDNN